MGGEDKRPQSLGEKEVGDFFGGRGYDESGVGGEIKVGVDGHEWSDRKPLENSLSAKTCWGMLVKRLKEQKMITLFTACGEIRDVEFVKNKLVVNVKESFLFNILNKDENKLIVGKMLKGIDDRIEIEIVKKQTKVDYGETNLKKLREMFGKELNAK